MGKEELDGLLKQFGEKVGIPDLAFDENGYCCLFFDDIVCNMELDEDGGILFLYTSVGEVPAEGKEPFYESLLEANFFFRDTAGATLGIDKDANIVSLVYQSPFAGLDYLKFEKTIQNFVDVSDSWMKRLGEFSESEEGEAPGDYPPPGVRA